MYFSFNFLISLNTDIFSLMYGEGFSCPIPFICLFNLKIDSSWAMAIKLDFIISRQSLKKYYHIYQHIFCMVRRTHYNNCNTAGFAKCNFSWLIVSTCIHVYMYCFASCLKIFHSFNIVGGELQNFGLCSDAYGLWAERYHYHVTPAVGGIFNIVTVPRSPHHSLNSCPILSM